LRDPPQVSLFFVEAREIDPPPSEEPIVWRLLTPHRATPLAEAAGIVELYRRRWIIEQLFGTLKSQGLDLEDSLLSDGEALERLAAAALIAAASVMQLAQGRGQAGATLSAARVFSSAEATVLEPLVRKLEGKTAKQKNPYPKDSLAWAAWGVARLGGWNGYRKERPPGPVTFARGLRRFHAIAEGFALANQSQAGRLGDFRIFRGPHASRRPAPPVGEIGSYLCCRNPMCHRNRAAPFVKQRRYRKGRATARSSDRPCDFVNLNYRKWSG
jgi:hypothetical protein